MCILFPDDVVLMDETRERVYAILEQWRQKLKYQGVRLSWSENEYKSACLVKKEVKQRHSNTG